MGAVDFSIDTRLVECLQSVLPISVFVETGTFEGDAIARVLLSFDEIHSIELSPQHYARAVARFAAESKVKLHQGDSAHVLGSLQPALAGVGVLYWLDAHWCVAHETAGQVSQCPVISELAAIGTLNDDSVILIDDARLFLSTPPHPHEVDDWPRFSAVLERLLALSAAHEISVINDVIVVFPRTILAAVTEFARRYGTDWLAELQHSAELEQERNALLETAATRLAMIDTVAAERDFQARAASERLAALEEQERKHGRAVEELQRERDLQARAAEQRLARIEELAHEHSATLEELTLERDMQARAAKERLATIEELQRELDTQRVTAAERLATIEEVARERLLHGNRPPGGWR